MSNNYSNEIKAYIENNMVMPNSVNEIMPNSVSEHASNLKSEIEDYEPTQLEIANGFTKENIQNYFTAVIRNDRDTPATHTQQEETKNKEEYEIISGENNATTILVHFPEEYKDFSKRVDFKNIKNEKWSIGLYTPEDETKKYGVRGAKTPKQIRSPDIH